MDKYECAVVGGGVVGLTTAWRTAQLGLFTVVLEAGPHPQGASTVAAGMLAPVTEAAFGEDKLLKLNLQSAELYPAFLDELSEAAVVDLKPSAGGTLFVALDRDQAEALKRLFDFQKSLGLKAEWLSGQECRDIEPALHPRARGGILARADLAVDPRVLLEALTTAVKKSGAEIRYGSGVERLAGGEPTTLTLPGGETVTASSTVLAAGCWSGLVEGAPSEIGKALRPVKGQILRLQTPAGEPPLLNRVIRTEEVYLVPRPSGEIAVGATVEEKGFDTAVTAGAVFELLRAADEAVPGIRELELKETAAGLRPGTPDNAPLLGPTSVEGVIAATGHYRNGILLAPVTAEAVASLIVKQVTPDNARPFSPARFR